MRPNRSDVHVSEQEEKKTEDETRQHFEAIAPKHCNKPQRSEYSSEYKSDASNTNTTTTCSEFIKFQHLENDDPQTLVYSGSEAKEEYLETEYYSDLNRVDKQHHTTGTGFIGVETTGSNDFNLQPDSATDSHSSSKGNPATNDWFPSIDETMIPPSDKPSRSENK